MFTQYWPVLARVGVALQSTIDTIPTQSHSESKNDRLKRARKTSLNIKGGGGGVENRHILHRLTISKFLSPISQYITPKHLPVSIGLKNACKISLSGNLTRTTTCKEEYRTYCRNNILHQNQIPPSCCVFCISLGGYDCVVGVRYPA